MLNGKSSLCEYCNASMLLQLFCWFMCSMSMKVPTIVQKSQQALQAGYCVVIGLQSTGEVCFICLLFKILLVEKRKTLLRLDFCCCCISPCLEEDKSGQSFSLLVMFPTTCLRQCNKSTWEVAFHGNLFCNYKLLE